MLSERQCQVVKLVADGKANKEIAAELNLSPGTVKIYLHRAMRELRVQNRTQVAIWLLRNLYG